MILNKLLFTPQDFLTNNFNLINQVQEEVKEKTLFIKRGMIINSYGF
jgi:hypothetical protein